MKGLKRLVILGLAALASCAEQIPDHVELAPVGAAVEVIFEAPSPNAYAVVGEVRGVGVGADAESAGAMARNDLRNKAGALGATLVTVDENLGEPMLLIGKTKVTVVGRAFKPTD